MKAGLSTIFIKIRGELDTLRIGGGLKDVDLTCGAGTDVFQSLQSEIIQLP